MTDPISSSTEERESAIDDALARPPIAAWLDEAKTMPARELEIIGGLARYVITLEMSAKRPRPIQIDRLIETIGFAIGVGLLGMKTFVEILQDSGFLTYPPNHGWPWGLFLACGLMVLPKFLGKATAGRVWGSIGQGISKRIGGGRADAPSDKEDG